MTTHDRPRVEASAPAPDPGPDGGLRAGSADPDAAFLRRVQVACTWCGPVFVVLLFGGWGLLAGFVPLIPASIPAQAVADAYGADPALTRTGLLLGMVGVFLTIPFFLVISLQLRHTERGLPVLSMLQFASGVIITVVLMIPMLLFVGGSFRPERPPELTMLVNDLSYVMLILPWPPIIGQLGSIGVAVLRDRSPDPVFPRWSGYYQLWVGVLLLPASLIIFFKSGPMAWTGIIGFWIPAAVFGVWYLVMAALLLRAVRREFDPDLAPTSKMH